MQAEGESKEEKRRACVHQEVSVARARSALLGRIGSNEVVSADRMPEIGSKVEHEARARSEYSVETAPAGASGAYESRGKIITYRDHGMQRRSASPRKKTHQLPTRARAETREREADDEERGLTAIMMGERPLLNSARTQSRSCCCLSP
jgi:hypothetical protein